jgi:hypothetical protein
MLFSSSSSYYLALELKQAIVLLKPDQFPLRVQVVFQFGRAVVAKDRSDMDDFYMGTSYGQQFLIIRNTCFVGVLVANCL